MRGEVIARTYLVLGWCWPPEPHGNCPGLSSAGRSWAAKWAEVLRGKKTIRLQPNFGGIEENLSNRMTERGVPVEGGEAASAAFKERGDLFGISPSSLGESGLPRKDPRVGRGRGFSCGLPTPPASGRSHPTGNRIQTRKGTENEKRSTQSISKRQLSYIQNKKKKKKCYTSSGTCGMMDCVWENGTGTYRHWWA